jgi:phenylpropionate dioxygenase-like ring-hydroxylating dioxygenase large terminal subunit
MGVPDPTLTPERLRRGLRRAWFPVAREEDLDRPCATQLLGEPIVVYRTSSGSILASSRRCPHRGGDLARGEVVGEAIACPYHGWRFGADGNCVHIPSAGDDAPIPPKAAIETYATSSLFGLVWTCLDEPLTGLPTLAEIEPMNMTFLAAEPVEVRAGILAALENFRDVAHFPFVHRGTMGEVPHGVGPLNVRADGFHTWLDHQFEAQAGEADVYQGEGLDFHYHSVVPSLASNRVDYGPAGQRIVIECFQPLGPTGCRIFMVSGTAEDYTGGSREDALAAELAVLAEDVPILDSLTPLEVPLFGEFDEVSVKADRYTLTTRKAFLGFIREACAEPSADRVVA